MLGRKLLTLACAVGILAFGACFGPPSDNHPPLPRLELQGIHHIRVTAVNVSESHHLDPFDVAQAVAYRINVRSRETGARAHVEREATTVDAVFAITILRESATQILRLSASGVERWSILVNTSATLTNADGQVIWSETGVSNSFYRAFAAQDVEELWKEPTLRNGLTTELSTRLAHRIFYARSLRRAAIVPLKRFPRKRCNDDRKPSPLSLL